MSLAAVLTLDAEEELEAAVQWYENRSAGLGARFLASVRATLSRIEDNPEQFPLVEGSIRRASVRRFPYAVFYRCRSDRLEVIAVFHNRRNPETWQERV